MKRLIVAALLGSAAIAHAQTTASAPAATASAPTSAAKKELIAKLMVLQQPGIENIARGLVEQPAVQMMQAAARALQTQVAPEKRDAAAKSIETDIRKYVDDTLPAVRERAVKLAPASIGPAIDEKFSEEELRQLVAWLDSPINKKYAQLGPEIQNGFMQKLIAEARPMVDPKLQALDAKVRTTLGIPAQGAGASAPAKAAAPARKASSK